MKSLTSKNSRIISILWASLIPVLLVLSLISIEQMDLRSGAQWENYYSIFTSDASILENYLNRETLPFISYNESEIIYNDISRMDTVKLKDLGERFSSLDPRLDLYMKSISQLFRTFDEETVFDILYVEKNSISPYLLYLKLFLEFRDSPVTWSIGGVEPLEFFLPLIVFFLSYIGFIVFTPFGRWKTAVALAGWIPFIFLYGISALVFSVALSFLVMEKTSLFFQTGLMLSSIIFFYYSSEFSILYIVYLLVGFFSIVYLLLGENNKSITSTAVISSRRWKEKKIVFKKPEHQLFSPVQILTPAVNAAASAKTGNHSLRYFTVFMLILLCGFSLIKTSPDAYIVPLPEDIPELTWSLENAEEILSENAIVSFLDYFTHIAFQEGFLYSSEWAFPRKEKPIVYPVYSFNEKVVSKSYEIIEEYTEKWFIDRVLSIKGNNPAKILFSTDNPSFVIKKSNHGKSHNFTLLQFSFSVLILLLIILSNGKKYSNISFKVRNKLLRRNEQVA